MVEGIVLAGGFSSRAKTNKMILKYNNLELILHTIKAMENVCKRIIVVTGHYHSDIVSLLANKKNIIIAYNDSYELGMFSSIQRGVQETTDDFFIIPGDCPTVSEQTYIDILNANKDIVVPSYCMKLGHPIFFKKKFREEILQTNIKNLKDFRNAHEFYILETEDIGILKDIDNLGDYKKLIRKG